MLGVVPSFSRTRLASERRLAGLSQPGLAAAADLKVATLRAIEQGRIADPKGETIAAIAQALGVPMERFYEAQPEGAAA